MSEHEPRELPLRMGRHHLLSYARHSHPGAHYIVSRSPEPTVVAAALKSPCVTHYVVERVSRRTDAAPFALRLIAEDPRWSRSVTIRRNLAFNPRTPADLARVLLAELSDDDLERATKSPRVTRGIAEHAATLLRKRGK